jgi:hypothetical protein
MLVIGIRIRPIQYIQSILLITATQSIQWMDRKKHRSRSPQYRIVSPLLIVIDAPRVRDLVSPLSLLPYIHLTEEQLHVQLRIELVT